MKHPLTKCDSRYGAQMGRPSRDLTGDLGPIKMHLEHMRLDSGGYDSGGAYWGLRPRGMRAYRFYWAGNIAREGKPLLIEGFIDCHARVDAKAQVLKLYPSAKFYN